MSGPGKLWRWAALVTCVVIAAAVVNASGPNARLRSSIAVHDFGHVVAFGVVAALLVFALSARTRTTFQGRVGATCLAAVAALALGAAVELAQEVSGLGGDPWDVVRDAAGALSVALTLIALDSALFGSARAVLSGMAIFVLAAIAYPVYAALIDEARACEQFPVLASFESTSELSRFHFAHGVRPRIVQITDEQGRAVSAVQLLLPPGKYPGLELRYFPGDWRGMRAIKLLIVNPEPTSIKIGVRMDDVQYRVDFDDRYNRSYPLAQGENRIEIPLSHVTAAPRDRQFDLGHVYSLFVFAIDVKQPHHIIIGPISLLR